MARSDLVFDILARDKTNKAFMRVRKNLAGVKNALGGLSGAMGGLLGTAGIGMLGAKFIQAASDAEEMGSKFNVVFGESARDAEAFFENLGNGVGRSTQELMEMGASIQDTFVPMGFARKDAAELSKVMTQLAVDVGSFNNKADADVMRDFQSALVGNHETVRKYGIVITQAQLGQELMRMGFANGVNGASEQAKAMARLNLIMAGTTDAQGDAVRTADSFANQMKALKGETHELMVELGEALMPVAAQVVGWLKEGVQWFKNLDDGTKQTILVVGGLVAAATPLILVLGGVAAAIGLILSPIGLTVAAVAGLTAAFFYFHDEIQGALEPIAGFYKNWIVDPLFKVIDWAKSYFVNYLTFMTNNSARIAEFFGADEIAAKLRGFADAVDQWGESTTFSFDNMVAAAKRLGEEGIDAVRSKFSSLVSEVGTGSQEIQINLAGSASALEQLNAGLDKTPPAIEKVKTATKEQATLMSAAVDETSSAFSDWIRTGEISIKGFAANVIQAFADILASQAANQLQSFLGGMGGGGGGGAAGGIMSALTSFFGFAGGGDAIVKGSGGTDSVIAPIRATPGEIVSVRTPAQMAAGNGGGGVSMPITINNDFSNSSSPLEDQRKASRELRRTVQSAVDQRVAELRRPGGILNPQGVGI